MCYLYAINLKRNAGIDRYQNISFQWLNRGVVTKNLITSGAIIGRPTRGPHGV